MATRDMVPEKKTGLEKLSLFELLERVAQENITYMSNLSVSTPEERAGVTLEYQERVHLLRQEAERREQLYLKSERNIIGH